MELNMSLSTQPLYPQTTYTNFLPTEFVSPMPAGGENFAIQKTPATAKAAATNDSPIDEAWAPMTAFLDAMQEAVSGVDEYLCVKYWNAPMARLTGVTRDEAMHRPLFSLLPRDFERNLEANLRHLFMQRAAGKAESAEIVAGEFSQRHGNSEFFDFSYRMRVLPATGNRGLAILTLQPVREGRSRRRRKEQPEPFGLLGQLSAGIAKELADPLDTICSKIDNIVALTGEYWNDDLEGELHSLITEVYRISYLVNNILTVSSPDAASAVQVDINHLIPEAVTLLEHTLNRQIACVSALQEGLPPVKGDPILLQSMLQNILRYAVEAAGEDAVPRIQTRLFVQQAANGRASSKTNGNPAALAQHLIIRIEDRGARIAPDVLAQIFDPIPCSKRFGIAVGLGLFISKKIAESHGGQIHVSSERGHGTIFTMAFKI
jgi:C4-dicarboxylate-specific signal transduction histidine kinase